MEWRGIEAERREHQGQPACAGQFPPDIVRLVQQALGQHVGGALPVEARQQPGRVQPAGLDLMVHHDP